MEGEEVGLDSKEMVEDLAYSVHVVPDSCILREALHVE